MVRQWNGVITIGMAYVMWNGGLILLGWWGWLWWLALTVNFVLFVMVAETVATQVPLKYQRYFDMGLVVIFPLLLLLSWEIIVRVGILNPRWFPPPSQITVALWKLTTAYDTFTKTSLLGRPWLIPHTVSTEGWTAVPPLFSESHLLITLMRIFGGFFIGFIPGILIGVVMGMNRTVRLMLDSTMSAFYVLPKIAIFPLMMLIFANPFGEGPKIAVIAIASFFLIAINTMVGVRDINPIYLEAGRNYGANRWQLFRHVIIPGALPVIFAGLRLALGTAIIATIAIEFVRARQGVGYLVLYYWEVLMPDKMYAALAIVMLLGITLAYLLQLIERLIMPWQDKS